MRLADLSVDSVPDGDLSMGGLERCDLSKLRYGYVEPAYQPGYTYLRSDVIAPDERGWLDATRA